MSITVGTTAIDDAHSDQDKCAVGESASVLSDDSCCCSFTVCCGCFSNNDVAWKDMENDDCNVLGADFVGRLCLLWSPASVLRMVSKEELIILKALKLTALILTYPVLFVVLLLPEILFALAYLKLIGGGAFLAAAILGFVQLIYYCKIYQSVARALCFVCALWPACCMLLTKGHRKPLKPMRMAFNLVKFVKDITNLRSLERKPESFSTPPSPAPPSPPASPPPPLDVVLGAVTLNPELSEKPIATNMMDDWQREGVTPRSSLPADAKTASIDTE